MGAMQCVPLRGVVQAFTQGHTEVPENTPQVTPSCFSAHHMDLTFSFLNPALQTWPQLQAAVLLAKQNLLESVLCQPAQAGSSWKSSGEGPSWLDLLPRSLCLGLFCPTRDTLSGLWCALPPSPRKRQNKTKQSKPGSQQRV